MYFNVKILFFFRILLDHGADANELYHREYRTGIKQGNSTVSKSRSKRSISTVEHVMRTANEKEKASELIEKLLSNVTNFEEAIELVLDDSSLSFKLLKIILNIAQNLKNSGSVDISDLINRKYRDESMTALHMAVLSNNTDDISEELAYLLENGGDVLIPGKDFRGNEYFVRDIKPLNNQ